MVKFSKQLALSLVPEWKDAYCNYKGLKKDVNRIEEDILQRMQNSNMERSGTLSRTMTRTMTTMATFKHNVENQVKTNAASGRFSSSRARSGVELGQAQDSLVVHKIEADCNGDPQFEHYETELLDPLHNGEADRHFFKKLDAQLNKVNRFYKTKEGQYVARAKCLERQLLTLFEVQEEHARQRQGLPTSKNSDSNTDDDDDDDDDVGITMPSKGHESPLLQSIVTVKSGDHLSRVNETHRGATTSEEESVVDSSSDEEMQTTNGELEGIMEPQDEIAGSKPHPPKSFGSSTAVPKSSEPQLRRNGFHIHEMSGQNGGGSPLRTRVNKADFRSRLQPEVIAIADEDDEDEDHDNDVDVETQRSVFRGIFKEPKSVIQDVIDLSLSKKKIQSSKKMLCKAFIEFYRGLGLLQSFSSLNLVAFAKITKKYDKVVKGRLGRIYVKEVERSYFASSNKVSKLMARVEDIFTKNFSAHDRRKAMAKLRPQRQLSGHMTTYLFGIFSGISMLLVCGFIVLLAASGKFKALGSLRYMDTVFYVFSSLALVLLHMFMYGWNLYAWQQTRINYAFIFELQAGTELKYRQVLLVSTAFTSLLLAAMITHIIISTIEAPQFYTSEFIPLATTLVFIVSLLVPINVLYKSSRAFFLRCLRHLILAPFHKVVLADFFLGDQLTSQTILFRNIEFMLCYYSTGYFRKREKGTCATMKPFRQLVYVFSMLPYWFRFLQCLRRFRDEGDKKQLWNAGKYASALIAVIFKTRYSESATTIWLFLFIIFSIIAMLYQLYWDLVIDWGLLQPHSKNPWLRDQLILKRKYLYFISMALNTVLRVAWLFSIQRFSSIPGVSRPGWEVIFAALEVIRRGHWNFYRLENEHLNNVGKYRAVKIVPLPFDESDGAFV